MSEHINDLLEKAEEEGILSTSSHKALAIPDIGARIKPALGIVVDDVQASEVVLVTQLLDDSGSIRFSGKAQAVRDGYNVVIREVLQNSKQHDSILAHTRYINGHILYPYTPIQDAVLLDSSNYDPMGATPLYDETVALLGTVFVKTQEFKENAVPARTITLIVTDGADEHSVKSDADTVRRIVEDMLKTEMHIIAAMGIDNGYTDFKKIFREMGIRDEWILLPSGDPREIRKAFQLFSRSAVRASQNAQSFSKTMLGGFANE